jgi:hypothetical protein
MLIGAACGAPRERAASPVVAGTPPRAPVAPPPAACPFVDVMPAFLGFLDESATTPPEARFALFQERVARSHPGIFTRAVLGYDDRYSLEDALARFLARTSPKDVEAIRRTSARVTSLLPSVLGRFVATFPSFRCPPPFYLLPSLGAFDGGTRIVGGRSVLFFGVDVIARIHTDAELPVLFAHEL